MRIEVTEVLEIIGYAIGTKAKESLEKHYQKYGDWIRIKDLIIKELVLRNRERVELMAAFVEYKRRVEEKKQMELPV